jgi:hypothetical protein
VGGPGPDAGLVDGEAGRVKAPRSFATADTFTTCGNRKSTWRTGGSVQV